MQNSDSESECHQTPDESPIQYPPTVPSPQSIQSTSSASSSKKRKISQVDDDDMLQLINENRKTREQILDSLLQNKKSERTEDDIDLFYKSVAMSVKRLPRHLISSAKTQHLEILNDLETKAANEQQGLSGIQHNTFVSSQQPQFASNQNQGFLNQPPPFPSNPHQARFVPQQFLLHENQAFLEGFAEQINNQSITTNNAQ